MTTRICIYCGVATPSKELSDEHIWPSALGGGFLPRFWRTRDVCMRCNSIAGMFVDAEFIKGLPGIIERYGAIEFVDLDDPHQAVFPLAYLGRIAGVPVEDHHIAEFWAGPCGANVIHLRPADAEAIWSTYAGGDPRRREAPGRVYVALCSANPFWVVAALRSVHNHFKAARPIYVVNAAVPHNWAAAFRQPNTADSQQAKDLVTVRAVIDIGRIGEHLHTQMPVAADTGIRFLAKIGLAIGYKLFGCPFLDTAHAKRLRSCFREANYERRRSIPLRGVSYLSSERLTSSLPPFLALPGAWVLALMPPDLNTRLLIAAPSGRIMSILVSDQPQFQQLQPASALQFTDGVVWIVAPTLGRALGPIDMPDYLAHRVGSNLHHELAALESRRIDRNELPPC